MYILTFVAIRAIFRGMTFVIMYAFFLHSAISLSVSLSLVSVSFHSFTHFCNFRSTSCLHHFLLRDSLYTDHRGADSAVREANVVLLTVVC